MRKIHWAASVIVLASSCLCSAQAKSLTKASPVRNTSYEAAGERILRHEAIVYATLEEAWRAFTTAEGLRTFAVPVVEFELKTGGKFHSNYQFGSKVGDPGTIYNTVLAYVPLKIVAFKIGLTDKFPAGPREAGTLFVVVEFEQQGSRKVKITLSMMGWGNGADWDEVYKHFDWGNAYTLKKLQERFLRGPLDWQEPSLKTLGEAK
jgi:uncharacterized protein YndB with AHSA1/START domain